MDVNIDFASYCVFPVSGGWCEWSEWTPCSRTCGAESVTRYRSCSCPEPKAGGAACSGEQETHSGVGVQIQRQPCPVITLCPGKTPPLITTIIGSLFSMVTREVALSYLLLSQECLAVLSVHLAQTCFVCSFLRNFVCCLSFCCFFRL